MSNLKQTQIMKLMLLAGMVLILSALNSRSQSANWQQSVWHEPQVRYLLADMTLGGNTALYRQYGAEGDPDSREAMRLWDAGVRVANTNEFERKWISNQYGKDGRVMRIVLRGTRRTLRGDQVLLSSDGQFDSNALRAVLLDLTLGGSLAEYKAKAEKDPVTAEALRCWNAGARVINASLFAPRKTPDAPFLYRATGSPASLNRIILNSDQPFLEANVRYFMADIALGGNLQFYRAAAESAHEMSCLEAVLRTEDGWQITNLGEFERKQVEGKTLITLKGSNARIDGKLVKLSSD